MRQAFDDALAQAHLVQKGWSVWPMQPAQMHGDILPLVVSMDPLMRVLQVTDGALKPVKDDLTVVVSSSAVGKRLLGFLCRQTLAGELAIIIEQGLKVFMDVKGTITLVSWVACSKQIMEQVTKATRRHELPKRRHQGGGAQRHGGDRAQRLGPDQEPRSRSRLTWSIRTRLSRRGWT